MIAAPRIHRGPFRVIRRLARKLLKPLRLAVIRHQMALSDQNVRYLDDMRIEAICALNAEHKRQTQLAARLMGVERGVL